MSRYLVLELCCFEWFQNFSTNLIPSPMSFRAVLVLPPLPHLPHLCYNERKNRGGYAYGKNLFYH